jgi:hypothetical protein
MDDTQTFTSWEAFEKWFDPILQETLAEMKRYSFLYAAKESSCNKGNQMLSKTKKR